MAKRKDIIIGIHAVEEAIHASKTLRRVFVQKDIGQEKFKSILTHCKQNDVPVSKVPKEKLNRLNRGNHQGIIALISPVEFTQLESLIPFLYENDKTPLLLVLDGITDARNFGAIIRNAVFLGANGVIVPMYGGADLNPDAFKTSAGSIVKIPICREKNFSHTLDFLTNSGIQLVAATEKGDKIITDVDFNLPTAIVMGSEDTGISSNLLEQIDNKVKIPNMGDFDSLNVSVATSIFLYEAVRQREFKTT
jgi:23S rRNA (guanosine2251-2'-O)-methyltransferase